MKQYGSDAAEAVKVLVDLADRNVDGVFTIDELMLRRREP